jgi:hypothetical protein
MAILVLIGTVAVLVARQSSSQPAAACVDPETRERVRALSLRAYDEAFVEHTAKLFVLFVTDPIDQPKRAQLGTQQAISAYIRSRAMALRWEPPLCDVPLPTPRG